MMDTPPTRIPYLIPSNKFYPPHIEHTHSLLRSELLKARLPTRISAKKAVVIEAQAGQGKTTLISQFLKHNTFDFLWYQIGPEDSDPFFLLSALLANCNHRFEDFHSPQLGEILRESEVGPLDVKRCANLLLGDLGRYLTDHLFIVFDDLHLLAGAKLTTTLLEYLLDESPPLLHFVLSSRHPLAMKSKTLRDGNRISYLNTDDLALSDREIEELFGTVLGKSISRQDAMDIHRVTNGWIMGIVLASHPISGRSRFWQQTTAERLTSGQGHMLDYFQDEIFDKIPAELHLPFLKLSFITEIPVDLATVLTGVKRFGDILSEMAHENFFVYHLDDARSVFRFHHFFQEFLQRRGRQKLTDADINHIHTREAEYYLERDQLDKALTSYKNAGDFQTMERLLKSRGMELIAKNLTLSILSLLDSIPLEDLFHYSWLTLFAALLRNDFTPRTTLPYYEKAKERFVDDGDEMGEIIALSQMIYFHFVISGRYRDGAGLLPRTAQLLKKNETTLPDHVKIMAARNLASGYCFFISQMDTARSYITMADLLASRLNSRNFFASVRFIQGYIELLCGNQAKYLREAETCYALLNHPLVGMSNKLTIRVTYLCYLSMAGDFLNFNLQQQAIQESIDPTVVDQTVAAPYLFIWGASCYFSLGKTAEAMELLERGAGIAKTAATSHMRSQLLQWQAFGASLLGEKARALALIEEAGRLREEAGGHFYETFNAIMAGAASTRVGEYKRAKAFLDDGISRAEGIPSSFLLISGLLQRSYLRLHSENDEAALDDLESGLTLMKTNGFDHFWGWEPEMMGRLLSLAARFDIERDFAQLLGRARLCLGFPENAPPLPLLHITLLDTFQLRVGSQVICKADDLTPLQRELFGLLITAKGQRISQERIQLELWPDTPPENARKSFDTLLARLRREIAKSSGLQIKNYIFMQKGILCLANYQLDSSLFFEAARRGMVHCKNNDWWQAGNQFYRALNYWHGNVPEDIFKSEQALTYSDRLTDTLTEFTSAWAHHMAETGRTEEAITLIERNLEFNILEEQLITLLYALYLRNNAPIKASETLERYRTALTKIKYQPEEIEGFITEVISEARTVLRES